jgi:hypothetical protein
LGSEPWTSRERSAARTERLKESGVMGREGVRT